MMRSILKVLKILLWALILVAAIYLYMLFRDGGSLVQIMSEPRSLEVVQDLRFEAEVQSIQIDWISGGITVTPSTDNLIHVIEKAEKGLNSAKYASIDASNGKLTIRSKNENNVWFFYRTPLTYLELQVPQSDYDEIVLNLTSGSHKVSNLMVDAMILDLTSGELSIAESDIARLNMTMTSGNAELILSQTEGFQFAVDKTSGNFTPSFNYTGDSDDPIYLEGDVRYTVDMTSGNVSVKVK